MVDRNDDKKQIPFIVVSPNFFYSYLFALSQDKYSPPGAVLLCSTLQVVDTRIRAK